MSTANCASAKRRFKISLLTLAISASPALWAQEEGVEHVDVVGQAAAIDQALKEQKNADTVRSVVHADGVG